MKKLFLLAIVFVLGTLVAQAQEFYLPEGMTLTGEQFHYDGFSIVETSEPGEYLYISEGNEPRFETLAPLHYNGSYGRLRSCRPYYYSGAMRWYIQTDYGRYIVWSDGSMSQISWRPKTYLYRYTCRGANFLNFLSWHYHHIPCIDYGHRHRSRSHNYYDNSNYRRSYSSGGRSSGSYYNDSRSSSRRSSSYDSGCSRSTVRSSGSDYSRSSSVRSSGSSSRSSSSYSSGSSSRSSSRSSSYDSGSSSRRAR